MNQGTGGTAPHQSAEIEKARMDKLKKYYEALVSSYQSISAQLSQPDLNQSLTAQQIDSLQEKKVQIRSNLQLLLQKFAALRQNVQQQQQQGHNNSGNAQQHSSSTGDMKASSTNIPSSSNGSTARPFHEMNAMGNRMMANQTAPSSAASMSMSMSSLDGLYFPSVSTSLNPQGSSTSGQNEPLNSAQQQQQQQPLGSSVYSTSSFAAPSLYSHSPPRRSDVTDNKDESENTQLTRSLSAFSLGKASVVPSDLPSGTTDSSHQPKILQDLLTEVLYANGTFDSQDFIDSHTSHTLESSESDDVCLIEDDLATELWQMTDDFISNVLQLAISIGRHRCQQQSTMNTSTSNDSTAQHTTSNRKKTMSSSSHTSLNQNKTSQQQSHSNTTEGQNNSKEPIVQLSKADLQVAMELRYGIILPKVMLSGCSATNSGSNNNGMDALISRHYNKSSGL